MLHNVAIKEDSSEESGSGVALSDHSEEKQLTKRVPEETTEAEVKSI